MKQFLIILLTVVAFGHFSYATSNDTTYSKIDTLIDIASKVKGTTYSWGGESTQGFDCSGFVKYCFEKVGIYIPHSSRSIGGLGIKVHLDSSKIGDVIVFSGTDGNLKRIGHVGIISKIENDQIYFMHASSSKKHYGVTETNYSTSNYNKRFIKVIRIIQ